MFVIIQARTSSKRLPEKVIKAFAGKPMILWTCERVAQAKNVTSYVMATSNHASDDELALLAEQNDCPIFRGSLLNVSDRFRKLLERKSEPAFIRVSGDSPLIDPNIIDKAIELFSTNNVDLVTNVHPRTFPKGQSVEVLRTKTFFDAFPKFLSSEHREHVTSYFYENETNFDILNFDCGENKNHIQLSVDTESDHMKLEKMVAKLGKDKLNLDTMIDIYESL